LDLALDEKDPLLDHIVDIEWLLLQVNFLREGANASNHFAGAIAISDDPIECSPHLIQARRILTQPSKRRLAVCDHAGERLIYFVSDRCG